MLTANVVQPATWGKTMQPNNINRGAVADSENMHYLRHMSYSKLYYHIVFVVKNRLNVIDEEHEQSLFVYIMGFC